MQIRLTCYSLSTFYDTRCPNISLAAVQILRCKTNWESMGARRRTKTATYTGMIVVPLGILLGWISCSGGAPQLKRLITATSLFYLTERPQFTATRGENSTTGARQRTNNAPRESKWDVHPLIVPLGFLFPGGSSTSAHVAPHTDLYSRGILSEAHPGVLPPERTVQWHTESHTDASYDPTSLPHPE